MGKKDIALARYFEDEDRYADLINGYVFSGEQVVSGSDILEKKYPGDRCFGDSEKVVCSPEIP